MEWKILSSKHILRDKWISLRADSCEMPNGKMIEPYYVLEYSDWINVVPVTSGNKIIMVREYRHGAQKTILELVSGCIEAADSSPVETAKRELLEETGFSADEFVPIGKMYPNPANQSYLVHSYLALNAHRVQAQNLDPGEEIEVVELPVEEVKRMLYENEIDQAMHAAALFYAFRYLEMKAK